MSVIARVFDNFCRDSSWHRDLQQVIEPFDQHAKEPIMIANRRKYVRIKSNDCSCRFELDGCESAAVVVDESIEGIRISGVNLMRLSLDQKITIHHKGVTIAGRCRSISRNQMAHFGLVFIARQPLTSTSTKLSFSTRSCVVRNSQSFVP